MQKYKCHKIVEGMLIDELKVLKDRSVIFVGHDKQTVTVDKEWMERHKPGIGGYFVRYEDGYESWSPAKAFEDGYRKYVEGEDTLFNPMVSELLALLDKIETESDFGHAGERLAGGRFDILKKYGFEAEFHNEGSAAEH